MTCMYNPIEIEQWNVFEAAFEAHTDCNPFTDVTVRATFFNGDRRVDVDGFYDGSDVYRIRFMPESPGTWRYETHSSHVALDGITGSFVATQPTANNHGPVRVCDTFDFAYADGSRYCEIGTTCYAWIHQNEVLRNATLRTLATSPFNKVRMCVFPKWYPYNRVEPSLYPFDGEPPRNWDFSRFNTEFFQHLDRCVLALCDRDIQADIILFHPYDEEEWVVEKPSRGPHWGFDRMGPEIDDRYVRYMVARYAAYRNVWWSLANEWDFVKTKVEADWNRIGQLVSESDPHNHLTSIHNGFRMFDHSQPWVTHVSLQSERVWEARDHRARYRKPVIYDECSYEGNIEQGWGNITAETMTSNFWTSMVGGAYCGHGETYYDPNDELWWSKGGILRGQSVASIAFLGQIMNQAPQGAQPLGQYGGWGIEGEYYLIYLGGRQPIRHTIELRQDIEFYCDLIDTWNMTINSIPGFLSGKVELNLPGRPYMALRILKAWQ